jgi:hypothetical protein
MSFRGCRAVVLQLLVAVSLPGTASERPSTGNAVQGPLSVTGEGLATSVLFPGAANNPGQFLSYFRTDVYLVNPSQVGHLTLILEAISTLGRIDGSKTVDLPGGGFAVLKDVLGQMGVVGGHVLLVRVDAARSTSVPPAFSAWAYTRTSNPIGPGEYGVTLPALAFVPLSSHADGTCVGAEISDAKRTNVGVVNESASELSVTVRAVDAAGMTAGEKLFTLPPWGFAQLPLSNFVSGPLAGGAVLFLSGSGPYIGYMVVNDNSSNDAFFEVASPNQ